MNTIKQEQEKAFNAFMANNAQGYTNFDASKFDDKTKELYRMREVPVRSRNGQTLVPSIKGLTQKQAIHPAFLHTDEAQAFSSGLRNGFFVAATGFSIALFGIVKARTYFGPDGDAIRMILDREESWGRYLARRLPMAALYFVPAFYLMNVISRVRDTSDPNEN
eukprot:CAMPEP_0114998702 /NCGR_PEP_ID=MMETSP0216-20121206/15677_1 /TAXON_ID=223996 /ORGANISM="Protocruzia adherens, Strain Boccale" /LENGTH=163 /DNA_ID=CAMNT_0002363375 /DNA_START=117 /DNA_END=608 /DNA_ORIENTATION=-